MRVKCRASSVVVLAAVVACLSACTTLPQRQVTATWQAVTARAGTSSAKATESGAELAVKLVDQRPGPVDLSAGGDIQHGGQEHTDWCYVDASGFVEQSIGDTFGKRNIPPQALAVSVGDILTFTYSGSDKIEKFSVTAIEATGPNALQMKQTNDRQATTTVTLPPSVYQLYLGISIINTPTRDCNADYDFLIVVR